MASAYENIWNRVAGKPVTDDIRQQTGYTKREIIQAHLEVFLTLPDMGNTPAAERYSQWGDYVNVMVKGGVSKAEREAFFYSVGMDPRDFGWEEWRAAMGYGRNE